MTLLPRLCIPAFLLAATIFMAAAAQAAEPEKAKTGNGKDYLPPFCEFTVDFPESPMIARRCADAEKTDCYTTANFTRVYDLDTSVGVRVSCNQAEPGMTDRYSEEVMKKTLEAMVREKTVRNYTLNATTKDWGKAATLFGEGTRGVTPTLYVAQIWVGKNSVFTVEGELSGKPRDESDVIFSKILKSVRPLAAPISPEAETQTRTAAPTKQYPAPSAPEKPSAPKESEKP